MTTRIFGSGIRRREDPRLITGQATYTDDVKLPGMVHAAILRSPHAHARIRGIDTAAAKSAPSVLAVYTGADTDGVLNPIPCAWVVPDSDVKAVPYPAIAKDTVRYVGDAVAVVVAENRYQAEDALELIAVDYEPLPANVHAEVAMNADAPQLHEDAPDNQAFHWVAAGGDTDAAFASAEVTVADTIVQQRLIPNAMEPRSAVVSYLPSMGELTIWNTTQNPHIARFVCSLVTGVPEHKIRVIAPEVGGGFGAKIPVYPWEMIAAFCSMKLGRPVKWTETRTENYQATIHGRDHVQTVELAATRDGKITGLRSVVHAGMGAYLSTAGPGIPTILHGLMYSGPYDIPNIKSDVYGVFTNTTPVDAYRGAGRPEATFLVERMVDLLARELGLDPVEVRRINLIPRFEDGFDIPLGITYDSGDYHAALDKVLEHVGYEDLRREQAGAGGNGHGHDHGHDHGHGHGHEHGHEHGPPATGHLTGIGVTTYCEICGIGPSQVAGAVGFGGGLWESAIVRFYATGKVNVFVGTSPHGQGEETTFAQIVSDELGVPVDDVEVIHGDTDNTPMGWGTYGSRTTVISGAAVALSSRKIKDKAIGLAAHLLEAAEEDIEYEDGKFFVRGSPDRSQSIQDIALMANVAWNMPEGMEPGLEASSFYDTPNFTFPFGAHVAVVSVDVDNGHVVLQRYAAVDDCGNQINPMIVEGQVHGGIVQGAGQALWEGAVYDDNGQLLTGSMLDYALPKAHLMPHIETLSTVTPSPHNPLGVKGIGETGTIASTVTIYNAVIDALKPFGITRLEMPLTPERVWQAIQDSRGHRMFAPEFDYRKANTVAEAIDLLAANPGAKAMAGGHSLIPLMKLRLSRPPLVVDIGGIAEMKGISVDNGSIRIGALTTHWEIESSPDVQAANSLLAEVAGGIGDTQVRNRGTIGGNLSHADPASDWGTALTALGATLEIQGPGGASRTVTPTEYILGPLTVALGENELLTSITVPALAENQRGEYAKMSHPASGYAVVGAAVVVTVDGNACTGAGIAVGGAVPAPTRVPSVENALTGRELTHENIAAATAQAAADLGDDIIGDFYASAEYRRAMAAVEIRHALFHATGVAHH